MKYQLKEPAVDFQKIVGEQYVLEDGSVVPMPTAGASDIGAYRGTQADGTVVVVTQAKLESDYTPL